MKSELLEFYKTITENQIKVVGTPQFEPYVLDRYNSTKKTFFEKFDLDNLKHISNIGITASASAPEILVQDFIKLIGKSYRIRVHEEEYEKENVFFKIPQHLKLVS